MESPSKSKCRFTNSVFFGIAVVFVMSIFVTHCNVRNINPYTIFTIGEFITSEDHMSMVRNLQYSWNPNWSLGFENYGLGHGLGQSFYYLYGPSQNIYQFCALALFQLLIPEFIFQTYMWFGIFVFSLGALLLIRETLTNKSWGMCSLYTILVFPLVVLNPYINSLQSSGSWYYLSYGAVLIGLGSWIHILKKGYSLPYLGLIGIVGITVFGLSINVLLLFIIATFIASILFFVTSSNRQEIVKRAVALYVIVLSAGILGNSKIYLFELLFPKEQLNTWAGYTSPGGEQFMNIITSRTEREHLFQWLCALLIFSITFIICMRYYKKTISTIALCLIIVGIFFEMGSENPLQAVINTFFTHIPLFRYYRSPHRFQILVLAGEIIAMGLALNYVYEKIQTSITNAKAHSLLIILFSIMILSISIAKNQNWFFGLRDVVIIGNVGEYKKITEYIRDEGKMTLLFPYHRTMNILNINDIKGFDIDTIDQPITWQSSLFETIYPADNHIQQTNQALNSYSSRLIAYTNTIVDDIAIENVTNTWKNLGVEQILLQKNHSLFNQERWNGTATLFESTTFAIIPLQEKKSSLSIHEAVEIHSGDMKSYVESQPQENPVVFLEQNKLSSLENLPNTSFHDTTKSIEEIVLDQLAQTTINNLNIDIRQIQNDSQCYPLLEYDGIMAMESGIHFLNTKPIHCPTTTNQQTYTARIQNNKLHPPQEVFIRLLIDPPPNNDLFSTITELHLVNSENANVHITTTDQRKFRWIYLGKVKTENGAISFTTKSVNQPFVIDTIIAVSEEDIRTTTEQVRTFFESSKTKTESTIPEFFIENENENEITFHIKTDHDAFALWKKAYSPYWQAKINGCQKALSPIITNYGLNGFIIPKGDHTIHISHKPNTLYRIALIFDGMILFSFCVITATSVSSKFFRNSMTSLIIITKNETIKQFRKIRKNE